MAKVRMYSDVEGDAKVGDIVDVSTERARALVMGGKATYTDIEDAGGHLPPVGGIDVEGRTPGVEPTKPKTKSKTKEDVKS